MSSSSIRAQLKHPIIDADGHHQEFTPFYRDQVLDYVRDEGGAQLRDKIEHSSLTYDDVARSEWAQLTDEQRRDRWMHMPAWWFLPPTTKDRLTAYLPAMMYERLDEMGIDFSVLYPRAGLPLPNIADPDVRA